LIEFTSDGDRTLGPFIAKFPPATENSTEQTESVWLLNKFQKSPKESMEQFEVVCSNKERALYNAISILDNITKRQFR